MRTYNVFFLTSLFMLSSLRLAPAQIAENAPPDQAFTVTSNVAYVEGTNGPLLADVYIPSGPGVHPGVVFIHGGGWKNGDRNQMIKLIKALAEDGYVCFTIEYDVDPVPFPASFHESLAAVKFFRDHAASYHLAPAHVAVAGSSAGGELAALVGLNPDAKPYDELTPAPTHAHKPSASAVQAALIFNGALDLTYGDDASSSVADYLGGSCQSRPRECKDASPLFNVHPGAPPFYVGHGTVDQSVPFPEAVAFTDALKKAHVPVEFFKAENGKHTYWADPRFYDENLKHIKAFLALHLRSAK